MEFFSFSETHAPMAVVDINSFQAVVLSPCKSIWSLYEVPFFMSNVFKKHLTNEIPMLILAE